MPEITNQDFNPCPMKKCGGDVIVVGKHIVCEKCNVACIPNKYVGGYEKENLLKWWNSITPARSNVEWKDDYHLYKKMADEAMENLLKDDLYIQDLIDNNPSYYDIPESIKASFDRFWATEDAWLLKRKTKKSRNINWKNTIRNNIVKNRVIKKSQNGYGQSTYNKPSDNFKYEERTF